MLWAIGSPLTVSFSLPVTAVTPMLKAAAQGPVLGPERKTSNGEMVNGELCRGLIATERLVGVPPIAARKNASVVILQRDEALQAMKPIEPPAMTSEAFCARLRSLLGSLRTLQASLERRAA